MTNEPELPVSVSRGELTVMGVTLVVHHLSDGRRIIESDSVTALFEAMNSGVEMTNEDANTLARALRGAA